ncbi:MAG: hypothetical protein OEW75_04590 [Cyclobacteriaceae bacterium]|nr:hypothetical protein [Cyclobacteriaceae bacterium]
MPRIFFLSIFLLSFLAAYSQEIDLNEQYANIQRAALLKEMDLGETLMETGKYKEADEKFRNVLKNIDVVPANLTFFIGKNSYYLEEFKQSINWLSKYLELKGTNGTFSDECSKLLKESEIKLIESNGGTYEPHEGTDTLFTHNYVDCGNNKVKCPVCKGMGVIIQKGVLGDQYKSCPYSDSQGLLTCDEYNLLLQGKLSPKN